MIISSVFVKYSKRLLSTSKKGIKWRLPDRKTYKTEKKNPPPVTRSKVGVYYDLWVRKEDGTGWGGVEVRKFGFKVL